MSVNIRPIEAKDESAWRKHWAAYNEFYERTGAITEEITATTFSRFLSKQNQIECAVAVLDKAPAGDLDSGEVVGFVTWFPHPTTYSVEDVIYLQDLFVDPACRNGGIGRKLIEHVYAYANKAGNKVYWHTQYFNHRAQLLYTKIGKRTDFIMYNSG